MCRQVYTIHVPVSLFTNNDYNASLGKIIKLAAYLITMGRHVLNSKVFIYIYKYNIIWLMVMVYSETKSVPNHNNNHS